mgnify:CR=1 FL=1
MLLYLSEGVSGLVYVQGIPLITSSNDSKLYRHITLDNVLDALLICDKKTNKSVIYHYKCTGLLKRQELAAYNLTRLWLGDYYLTYPQTTTEDELIAALACKTQFIEGKFPLFRDDLQNLSRGYIVRDRNYLSARWPGDIYNFSLEFINMLTD